MLCTISEFQHIRPRHEIDQEQLLAWIARVHGHAQEAFDGKEMPELHEQLGEKMLQLGLGKERILKRGIHTSDFFQEEWGQMEIYPVKERPEGASFAERSHFYDREVTQVLEQFYPGNSRLPPHLIHVTCTGYVAPSPVQKLVASRKKETVVTHAYHMGCYAAIPAIRMGAGFTALPSPSPVQVDVVHTELCSLHMHPLRHSTEQLVVNALFADGFIKYAVSTEAMGRPHYRVLALHEEIIPDSIQSMSWRCEDKGLGMTLAKDVPVKIVRSIQDYLSRLSALAEAGVSDLLKRAYFAIHPGGPKILQQIKEVLQLESWQIAHSEEVLRACGNMSSATLPHIWEMLLNDPKVADASPVVNLAFGPGLSIAGGVFEKRMC